MGSHAYIVLDCDVSPKGTDGYAPMKGYLGHEGYALALELREGKQHSQKGTPDFLTPCLREAQAMMAQRVDAQLNARLLVRPDLGHDSTDNMDVIRAEEADFLIKQNLRQQSLELWLDRAQREGVTCVPREGQTIHRGALEKAPRRGPAPNAVCTRSWSAP